ncbi:MAG: hypothetical protein ACREIT_11150, partial [Tepidisphaeraceae bacterium]
MSESSDMTFSCGSCGKSYKWKPELAGKKAKCKCGAEMHVPAAAPVAAPVARAAAPVASRPVANSQRDDDDGGMYDIAPDEAPKASEPKRAAASGAGAHAQEPAPVMSAAALARAKS